METWLSVAGVGGGGVLAAACAYKVLRPRFPVRVNCWFCSADTVVPYGNQNCWDCPKCEQYNGFEKDGGYNKEIPAQHLEDLNHGIGCKPDEYLGSGSDLCEVCEQNQLLKVKQLASFVPMIEDNYDAEVDAYKDHLERVYELCDPCKIVVERELMKQDDALRGKLEANKFETSAAMETSHSQMVSLLADPSLPFSTGGYLLGLLCLLCACLVLSYRLSRYHWIHVHTWLLTDFVHAVHPFQQALHYTGLGLCLMSKLLIGKDRLRGVDVAACFTWLLCAVAVTREITHLLPSLPQEDKVLAILFSVNFVFSFTCCIIKRARNTATTKTFKRLSLDKSTASMQSETDTVAISSVSTSRRAQPNPDPVSQLIDEPMDDLDLELDAFSLGPKTNTLKRSDSGMFSMAGSQASFSAASAVPRPLLGQPRPLISPARLNIRLSSSTPTNTFNPPSTCSRPFMTNPSFDSRSRQSLQFTSIQKPSSDNLFLQQSLTAEKLSLFNSQQCDNPTNQPPATHRSSVLQSQASPLKSSLWQHAKFAQTHLSPDKLSQCRFSSLSGNTPPAQPFQGDTFKSVSRPSTPIRKSLWQQHVVDDGQQTVAPVVENNVFTMTGKSKCISSQPSTDASLFNNTSTSFLTSLDSCELRQRQGNAIEKESTKGIDESTKSSVCPVDSTTVSEPSKFSSLRKFGIGVVLFASVMGNAVLGVYLYSKS